MQTLKKETPALEDCRNSWASTLEELAANDPRIVAVVNDSVGSSKLDKFQKRFPERVINVGIAEQNMVGVSAGLANGGKIPFVSAASCFLTGRAMEQIKADIAYADFNVKLVGQSSGIAYGELGATHHSIEDFAWLRALSNIKVVSPSDAWETAEAVKWAAAYEGPVFLRLSRMPVPNLDITNRVFTPNKAEVVRRGNDITIVCCGTTVHLAVAAADLLATQSISAGVLNASFVHPIDEEAILSAAEIGPLVTVEEALTKGGLGGAVAELTASNKPIVIERVGFPGFLPTGSAEWLFLKYGISAIGIAEASKRALQRAESNK